MIDSQDTRYFAIFMDRVKPVLDKDTVSLEFDEGGKSVLKITDHNPLNIHISYSKKTSKKLRLLFSMPTTKTNHTCKVGQWLSVYYIFDAFDVMGIDCTAPLFSYFISFRLFIGGLLPLAPRGPPYKP